jgi:hypothetical protein
MANQHTNKTAGKTLQERFESYVIAEPMSGCFLWTPTQRGEYGQFNHEGKMRIASRVAWELYVGPIPEGMNVLHKCDTPACVNPYHLFLGTLKDNTQDSVKKWRHRHKLTEDQILAIRNDTRSCIMIAKEYEIGKSQVSNIRRQASWEHLF